MSAALACPLKRVHQHLRLLALLEMQHLDQSIAQAHHFGPLLVQAHPHVVEHAALAFGLGQRALTQLHHRFRLDALGDEDGAGAAIADQPAHAQAGRDQFDVLLGTDQLADGGDFLRGEQIAFRIELAFRAHALLVQRQVAQHLAVDGLATTSRRRRCACSPRTARWPRSRRRWRASSPVERRRLRIRPRRASLIMFFMPSPHRSRCCRRAAVSCGPRGRAGAGRGW